MINWFEYSYKCFHTKMVQVDPVVRVCFFLLSFPTKHDCCDVTMRAVTICGLERGKERVSVFHARLWSCMGVHYWNLSKIFTDFGQIVWANCTKDTQNKIEAKFVHLIKLYYFTNKQISCNMGNSADFFRFFWVTAYLRVFIQHLKVTNVQNKVFTKK